MNILMKDKKDILMKDTFEKITVLVFGTFDLLHPGHEWLLQEAKELGDELVVVVARDETVVQVKGRKPHHNEQERIDALRAVPVVDRVMLGHVGDKYAIIEEIKPDVICLGYDQTSFVDSLAQELASRGLNPKIVRFTQGFETHKHKTSRLRNL